MLEYQTFNFCQTIISSQLSHLNLTAHVAQGFCFLMLDVCLNLLVFSKLITTQAEEQTQFLSRANQGRLQQSLKSEPQTGKSMLPSLIKALCSGTDALCAHYAPKSQFQLSPHDPDLKWSQIIYSSSFHLSFIRFPFSSSPLFISLQSINEIVYEVGTQFGGSDFERHILSRYCGLTLISLNSQVSVLHLGQMKEWTIRRSWENPAPLPAPAEPAAILTPLNWTLTSVVRVCDCMFVVSVRSDPTELPGLSEETPFRVNEQIQMSLDPFLHIKRLCFLIIAAKTCDDAGRHSAAHKAEQENNNTTSGRLLMCSLVQLQNYPEMK